MIMTNVKRSTKFKYINVDTKYRDEPTHTIPTTSLANVNITLPEIIRDVTSLELCNAEVPITFYSISAALGNNYFQLIDMTVTPNVGILIDISDGEYDTTSITTAINDRLIYYGFPNLVYSVSNNHSVFTYTHSAAKPSTIQLAFNVNLDGTTDNDVFSFKRKLGWALGFRGKSYPIIVTPIVLTKTITSTQFIDLTGLKYIYLAIDEYGKGTQNTFISNYNISLVGKNIIGKLCLNKRDYPFGINTVQPFNAAIGSLLSERRVYNGKIDMQRINVVLMDDIGNPIDLNGHEFSFCIMLEHE
jgi:hypothetical protein